MGVKLGVEGRRKKSPPRLAELVVPLVPLVPSQCLQGVLRFPGRAAVVPLVSLGVWNVKAAAGRD